MMNIALFASAFFPSLGGVEELCRQLALELMRQGHHVIVLTNRWPRDLPPAETIDGIPVYRLPFRLPEGSAKAAVNYHLTHYRITQRMLLILHENKINLLHVQCVSSNAHYAMIARQRLGLPLVVTLQGELTMDANQIFQKSAQARDILRKALDNANVITGCSGKTLRDGEEFYGKPFGDRGRVIFNGVNLADFAAAPARVKDQKPGDNRRGLATETDDGGSPQRTRRNAEATTTDFHHKDTKAQRHKDAKDGGEITEGGPASRQVYAAGPTETEALLEDAKCPPWHGHPAHATGGQPYIFALGRLVREKGFDILIHAFAQSGLAATHDLVIAGSGPEMENLKRLAGELRLAERVHFPGRADRSQVAAYLLGCAMFVLASPAEPFGIVILEAMAAGAPVIAVNNAGPAEIITNGANGLLVDRSEPDLLAAAMQRLAADAELRNGLAAAGKARAAEFAWPKIAGEYIAAYAAASQLALAN